MKRKYKNLFRYAGMSRLSHCVGEDWEEVWVDPFWITKPMNGNRTRFIWNALLKQDKALEPLYNHPVFKTERKYTLVVTETENGLWLSAEREIYYV